MKFKSRLIYLVVMSAWLLSACGLENVTEKQIKQDIIESEVIQNCYISEFVNDSTYTIKEYDLVKEQFNKEKKEDIIFCKLTLNDEYFNVYTETKLIYNYYDKGGWVLDDITMEVIDVIPMDVQDAEAIVKYIQNNIFDGQLPEEALRCLQSIDGFSEMKYISGGDLIGREASYDSETNVGYVYVDYISATLDMSGYFKMHFEDDEWHFMKENSDSERTIIMMVDEYSTDYTKALGCFEIDWDTIRGEIQINDISNEMVTYDLYLKGKANGYKIKTGENLTAKFDDLAAEFVIGELESEYSREELSLEMQHLLDIPLIYESEKDCWSIYGRACNRR